MSNINQLTRSEIESIYDAQVERIFRFFYYKTLSKEIAEDLTSDTFLTFVEKCHKEQIDNPRNFLYGIARNVFLKFLQNKYRLPAVSLDGLEEFVEYVDDFVDQQNSKATLEDRLQKYIKLLPVSQARIIQLRLIEKYSLSEISAKLNKDMNYVKTTQKRALKKLKYLIACTP